MEKKKVTRNQKIAIAAGVCTAFVIMYGVQCFSYKDVFLKGTTINDMSCENMTVAEVESMLKEQVENYQLEVVFRDDVKEVIVGEDIQYAYESTGEVQKIFDQQNPFLWFTGYFKKRAYDIQTGTSFDKEKLVSIINEFEMVKDENQKKPENAFIKFDDKEFVIIDEEEGTTLLDDLLIEKITDAVEHRAELIALDKCDVYQKPEITKEDETLHKQVEQLNTLAKVKVTYTLPNGEKVLSGEEIVSWLEVDEEGNYVKNEALFEEKISEYVKALAKEVNTVGKGRPFTTTSGKNVEVKGGTYGWKINQKKEIAALKENIDNLESVTREPEYSSKELYTTNNGLGDTYIEINLTEQRLYYYVDGKIEIESPLVSGMMTADRYTPAGVYFLTYKQEDKVLRGRKRADGSYSYESPVDYWMPFNGGIGLHDAQWRGSFGGTIYKYSGSHGCINLPLSKAKQIYKRIDKETPIVCVYTHKYSIRAAIPEPAPTTASTPTPTSTPVPTQKPQQITASTPVPTQKPTEAPTPAPTQTPTATPTPTPVPTAPPTPEPTTPPTPEPTVPSTPEPTPAPTQTPSETTTPAAT